MQAVHVLVDMQQDVRVVLRLRVNDSFTQRNVATHPRLKSRLVQVLDDLFIVVVCREPARGVSAQAPPQSSRHADTYPFCGEAEEVACSFSAASYGEPAPFAPAEPFWWPLT